MNSLLQKYWVLLLIAVLALFLRTIRLSEIPVGLHGDEASIGYNAYSLLKTGKDQNGNVFPLSIDQFGDFRPAGYHYIDIPFVAVLGLNTLSVRLPAALFGAATVFLFYFLLLELFDHRRLALVGSLLLAISPWHIIISRATSEGVIAAFFVILGVYFFLKTVKQKNPSLISFSLSFFFFFVSFLFYHSARLFVPVFLIPLLIYSLTFYRANKKVRNVILGLSAALFIVLFFLLLAGKGTSRPLDIGIFNVPGGSKEVKQQQDEEGTLTPVISRFLHNKFYFYTRVFMSSYFLHLNGNFLFLTTGKPVRYDVPWSGNSYPAQLPFLVIGFAILLSEGLKQKKFLFLIPVLWFFIGALPAGLTWEDIPNIQRSSLMIYPEITIIAFGFYQLVELLRGRTRSILIFLSALFLLQNAILFFHNYFYHTLIHEPWNRSASEPELLQRVFALQKDYKAVVMTSEHNNNFIFYLFYNKFDPLTFQKMGSPREHDGLHFKNLIYTSSPCPLTGDSNHDETSISMRENLYLDKEDCKLPKNASVLDIIRTPDGIPAFQIVKLLPPSKI